MSESQRSTKKNANKWWQFSIRTLLTVAAAVAIIIGVFFNPMRTQHNAVNAIEKLGGRVTYEDAWLAKILPNALQEYVGIHATKKVVSVKLSFRTDNRRMTTPTKDELASFVRAVKRLPHVTELSTYNLDLKDCDLAIFAPLKNQIEVLVINEYFHVDFRGTRLELLQGWDQLRSLSIFSSLYTGVDLEHTSGVQLNMNLTPLSKLPNLESLSIGSGHLNDQLFEELTQIQKLKKLSLSYCGFDGKAFSLLAKSRHLEQICLHNIHTKANFGAWSYREDGSKYFLGEPTFNFEQSSDAPAGKLKKQFPQNKYDEWIKATFGDIEIDQLYSS